MELHANEQQDTRTCTLQLAAAANGPSLQNTFQFILWGPWSKRNGRTVEMFCAEELAVHLKFVAMLFPDCRCRRDWETRKSVLIWQPQIDIFSRDPREKGNNFASLHMKLLSCPHERKRKKKDSEKNHASQWCSVYSFIFDSSFF